jgi:hypothetical protein
MQTIIPVIVKNESGSTAIFTAKGSTISVHLHDTETIDVLDSLDTPYSFYITRCYSRDPRVAGCLGCTILNNGKMVDAFFYSKAEAIEAIGEDYMDCAAYILAGLFYLFHQHQEA